ncbi:tetratricopeptide repeat protein 12 isoform X2 [Sitodiplosis mosellana]|uniref:tetratricopeptide repeat protein 12 isoform X2 n=1 Tax=Sitodiplosis mosellana TaxID=263140 RepID=UPI002444F924|nr:tetratricopeptide repeat protein 12 isoform X2 [Sitodiplosis mosellana]
MENIPKMMHRQQTQAGLGKDGDDFRQFENKIDEVLYLLKGMNNCDRKHSTAALDLGKDKLSADDFVVKITENRTVINKEAKVENFNEKEQMEKLAFMQEVERDAARRAEERKEREAVAQNLRKMGNEAFRNGEYEKAIGMYSKAIDQVKDSPVLYNNRALAYIRLGLYKKAVIDADFVLQKLDEKNVRSWLYRAKSYYLLGERRDFEKSVNEAKKNNPKGLDFIEKTVASILENKTI